MNWSAIYNLRHIVMTKTMTVDFFKPVYVGEELGVEGRVIEQAGKREVIMEGQIYKNDDILCVQARGTFAMFTAKAVKKMNIMPPEVLEGFGGLLEL